MTLMKTENERLLADVEKLKQRLREEITRTTAGVRLDLNLEKGETKLCRKKSPLTADKISVISRTNQGRVLSSRSQDQGS